MMNNNELTTEDWTEMTERERRAYLEAFNDDAARDFESETGRRAEVES